MNAIRNLGPTVMAHVLEALVSIGILLHNLEEIPTDN
jgi:hypothetical protein